MSAPSPELAAVMAALAQLPGQITGRDGQAIRGHVERLAQILGADGPDAELRSRAAGELEQLIAAVTRFTASATGTSKKPAAGAVDLGQLADGLRTFVELLRAPSTTNQAQVEQMVATLQGVAVPRPVPLDELRIDGTVEALAHESARRHGLAGAEARRAVERMKRDMAALVRQLEARAHQEASRARTAADMDRLFDAVVQTGSPLGQALAGERAAVLTAFRSVDLAHMAEGLRVYGVWLSTPADDPAVHVAQLKTQLAEVLGPPTMGDPARSEAERRADFERDIQVAVDQIFPQQPARGIAMTQPADPQLAALAALVGRVAQILQGGDDPAGRAAAAASVDELRAVVAKQVAGATGGLDLGQITDALAAFASWLHAPTPDGEARAERAMSELQTALGPLVGWDPAREDAARRAQYRREARAALDEIFPDKPKR